MNNSSYKRWYEAIDSDNRVVAIIVCIRNTNLWYNTRGWHERCQGVSVHYFGGRFLVSAVT